MLIFKVFQRKQELMVDPDTGGSSKTLQLPFENALGEHSHFHWRVSLEHSSKANS